MSGATAAYFVSLCIFCGRISLWSSILGSQHTGHHGLEIHTPDSAHRGGRLFMIHDGFNFFQTPHLSFVIMVDFNFNFCFKKTRWGVCQILRELRLLLLAFMFKQTDYFIFLQCRLDKNEAFYSYKVNWVCFLCTQCSFYSAHVKEMWMSILFK